MCRYIRVYTYYSHPSIPSVVLTFVFQAIRRIRKFLLELCLARLFVGLLDGCLVSWMVGWLLGWLDCWLHKMCTLLEWYFLRNGWEQGVEVNIWMYSFWYVRSFVPSPIFTDDRLTFVRIWFFLFWCVLTFTLEWSCDILLCTVGPITVAVW